MLFILFGFRCSLGLQTVRVWDVGIRDLGLRIPAYDCRGRVGLKVYGLR